MKSISSPAMAAIEAGEAIVTGAVEILGQELTVSSVTTVTEDFTAGLGGFTVYIGSAEGFSIVSDTYGNCLQVEPGPNNIDAMVQEVGDNAFSDVRIRFKVTATGADDLGIMDLRDSSGGVVFSFNAGRQASIDPLRRPSVSFREQPGIPSNPIGPGAVTIGDWYELHASYSAGSFAASIDNLTTASNFGSTSIPVTTRTAISKLIFRTDNAHGGGTVRWDGFEVDLDVVESTESPLRVWGGFGPITIDGEVYQGIGDRGLAQQTAGAIGGFAQGIVLTLSGVEPEVLELLEADEVKGAPVVLRRLIFASDGKTLLDSSVFDRGRVDTIETVETIGSSAAVSLAVESAARGLGSSGARMRSDADQRLINATDGYFKHTAFAGEKSLYWGGRKPNRAGSALSGSSISTTQFSSLMQGTR